MPPARGSLTPFAAQLYHPGEQLQYRVSYKAKMFPNTEVGSVEVCTYEEQVNGEKTVPGRRNGRTLPTYRWFFNLEDLYTRMDRSRGAASRLLRERHPRRRLHLRQPLPLRLGRLDGLHALAQPPTPLQREADGPDGREHGPHLALLQPLGRPGRGFHRRRARNPPDGPPGHHALHPIPLSRPREQEDPQHGPLPHAEVRLPVGNHRGLFVHRRTVFTLWVSDDRNKIPLYIESPVKIGSIQAYISGYKGLKYPVESLVK